MPLTRSSAIKSISFPSRPAFVSNTPEVLTELLETGERNDRTYTNLFPSLFLGYEFNEGSSIQLSYSKRISRPRFWDLNPFFTFADARNIFSGNPNVDPEFTDSYEIGYLRFWDKASITSSIYYRHTTGVIQRIQTLLEEDGEPHHPPPAGKPGHGRFLWVGVHPFIRPDGLVAHER